MTDAFWSDVAALFDEATHVSVAVRSEWLDRRCHDRPDVRREVESLLRAHDASGDFLATSMDADATTDPAARFVGRSFGGFRIIEPIGHGGMSVVYRAERAGEFSQDVAVKLIDATARNADAMRRFRTERQVMADLRHPHIVALLDGGVTPEGQAYLVMEYVQGVSITRYCRDERLSLAGRLMLFRQICTVVQHAHQHGVIHRDLKPDNILITPDGAPKILDFGVAKLIDVTRDDANATATGVLGALTPNYASPEQLRGLSVTTSSDLYSLGVLLYELVTGARPYDVTNQPLDVMLQRVGSGHHSRPSAVPSLDSTLPYALSALRGDLDTVVMKALSVVPEDRYASAEELGADVGRLLARQPVVAQEPTLGYLVANLARRHRAAVVSTAVAAVALAAALAVSVYQTRVSRLERDRAEQRFNDVRRLANALIFKIHDGVQPLAGSTEVRKIIVTEALTYLEKLSTDPTADVGLKHELARGYLRIGIVQGRPSVPNLGDRAGAKRSLEKAIALLVEITASPQTSSDVLRDLISGRTALADVVKSTGDATGALRLVAEAVQSAETLVAREPSPENRWQLGAAVFQHGLAVATNDSAPVFQRSLTIFQGLLDEAPTNVDRQRNVALAHKQLGSYYGGILNGVEATRHYQQALQLDRARLDANPTLRSAMFDVAIDLGQIANEERKLGNHAASARYYEESLTLRQQVADADQNDVQAKSRLAYVHVMLSNEYRAIAKPALSLDHAKTAVKLIEPLAGLDNLHRVDFARALTALAWSNRANHAEDVACRQFRRSVAVMGPAFDNGAPEPETDGGIRTSNASGLRSCPPAR